MKFPVVYAVKHKDFETRMASRSGGIFTALSDYVFSKNGIVYGCVLDKKFQAYHTRAESADERNLMRGSKYIQSRMNDCFRDAETDLLNGKMVMFTGTSCQIAGLKAFLSKGYENLIVVDIVCHGVPSPLVWEKYIEWQERTHNGKCIEVDFRNKKDFGWASHFETLMIKKINGETQKVSSNVFTNVFYNHSALRPSCYKCPYKDIIHPADITIADYWGIDVAAPGFNDNKGVSLVLINNEKGAELFDLVKNSVEMRETEIEKSMQPALKAPFSMPDNRSKFWKDFRKKDFGYIAKKYGTRGFMFKIKQKLKKFWG